jgi:chorismate mutase
MAESRPEDAGTAPRRPGTAARLDAWRRDVDAVDRELLRLLQRRGDLVVRIARLKRQAGLAARDPDREGDILADLGALAAAEAGPYGPAAIVAIFRAVLDASLELHLAPADERDADGEAAPAQPGDLGGQR